MQLPLWAVLALSAAGCSLIIPLDYTGGVGGSSGSGGASAGAGNGGTGGAGNAPQGGTSQGAEAGAGDEGGNPQGGSGPEGGKGGSSPGGTDTGGHGGTDGGTSGKGGTSGGVGGSSMGGEEAGGEAGSGTSGTSGGGVGGAGGAGGATGGRGGRGGSSGSGGMGGTAGCSFDLTSNPMHCGSCTNACPSGDECIDSKCVATPCDKLGCGSVQTATNSGGGMRKDSVGTTNDVCVEVPTYTPDSTHTPAINCWNADGRTTQVNEVAVSCGSDQPLPMPKRKGGYCVQFGAGESAQAGFVMPFSPGGCCKIPSGGTGGT